MMDYNVTFLDKVLANRTYLDVVSRSVSSIGYANTIKMILLRLNVLGEIDLELEGKRIHTDKDNFPYVLHDKIWAVERANKKIKIGKKEISFYYKGKKVVFKVDESSDAVTNDTLGLISEQFFSEQYGSLDIRGRDVVDIGANIGDSAIFFALNGARRVLAYEPYPHLFDQAMRNISANHLDGIIGMNNEGVSGKSSTKRISTEEHGIGSSRLKDFKEGKKVKVVTLKQIVGRYSLKNALLKSDCEGSEYDILMNADEPTLRAFRGMMIEYHDGYINLVEKLKGVGFDVWHSRPSRMLHADGSRSSYAGIIKAERIE